MSAQYDAQQLKLLIAQRQAFEKQHHVDHPTTINFADIYGNTLLHYAAELGDLDEVKRCINAGADIEQASGWFGETPIKIALIHGHVEVANFLYGLKADCSSILLSSVDEKAKPWFSKIAKEALHESFPDPANNIRSPSIDNPFFNHAGDKDVFPEKLAISIGDKEFIESIQKGSSKALFDENLNGIHAYHKKDKISLLAIAAASDQLEIAKLLLALKANIHGDNYTPTPLTEAISNKAIQVRDYLLTQNPNVNVKTTYGKTPLLLAIAKQDLPFIQTLLAQGARLDITDINGNNVLHQAVLTQNLNLIQFILSKLPDQDALITQKNRYGFSPLDFALQQSNFATIKLLAPYLTNSEIKASPEFGKCHISINQNYFIRNVKYYLTSHYRSTNYLQEAGYCFGLSFLFDYYNAIGLTDAFYRSLEKLSAWAGDLDELNKPFAANEVPFATNLGELFEYWISIVTALQNAGLTKRMFGINHQHDKKRIMDFVGNDNTKIELRYFHESFLTSNVVRTKDQLAEILRYLCKLAPNLHMTFTGQNHATSAAREANNTVQYYDPNCDYRVPKTDDPETLAGLILNYKYKLLKKYYKNQIGFEFALYDYNSASPEFAKYPVFTDAELPFSSVEAFKFQAHSPNKYTHLHLAVITQSVANIKKLLKDGCVDLHARDVRNLSAFDYTVLEKDFATMRLLIDKLNNDLTGECQQLLIAYQKNNNQVINELLKVPGIHGLEEILKAAVIKSDQALVMRLIKDDMVDLVMLRDASLIKDLLNFAKKQKDHDLLSLILCKAHGVKSIVNHRNKQNHTLLHEAVIEGNLARMNLLLTAGSDKNALTTNKDTPMIMLLKTRKQFPEKLAMVETLLKNHADVRHQNFCKKSAIDYVLESNDQALIKLFQRYKLIPVHKKPIHVPLQAICA